MPANTNDLQTAVHVTIRRLQTVRGIIDDQIRWLQQVFDSSTPAPQAPKPYTLMNAPLDVPDVAEGRVRGFTTSTIGEVLAALESTGFAPEAIDRRLREATDVEAPDIEATPGRDAEAGTEPGRGEASP